jgi:hypothetical protein
LTAAQIGEATGLSVAQVQSRRQRLGWRKPPAPAPEFDEAIPDRWTWEAFDELFGAIASVKAAEKKYDPRKHRIGAKLGTEKPVAIVFTSDWQLGSEGVDFDLWRSDMDRLREFRDAHPGSLYCIGLGDYGSHLGILAHGGSQNRDIVKSGDQFVLLQQFFHLTAGMWLVLLQGCHDTFVSKAGAIDTIERYCELSGARHGWHGVELDLTVGQRAYLLRLRHRFKFNSTLNPFNSLRRQAEMEGPADVIAHAHLHTNVTGTHLVSGRRTIMLRAGSYQIHDDYARQYVGNVKAEPLFPMVVFPARGEDRPMVFDDFHQGLSYLERVSL